MRQMRNNKRVFGEVECVCKNVNPMFDNGKPIIAVDFDGTLVKNKYPFIENPNLELLEYIKANRKRYVWVLWTCRNGKQLQMAVDYLWNEFELRFDSVNENLPYIIEKYGDSRKIYADYYIDDKNADIGFLKNSEK